MAKWPKIHFGAKLRYAINEQKWTSMRNVSNSRWWQNGQVWTAVRSWDALKLNKNDPRCGILRIHANSMLWQNDPKWTSVRSWDALKMIKMNLGAQCFVIDAVSKMTQTEKAKFTRVSLRNNHKVAALLQPLFGKVSSGNVVFPNLAFSESPTHSVDSIAFNTTLCNNF